MYINDNIMRKLNSIQLNIFKEFINVCEKLNLCYFLVHGSLLGALRYKGFFPMDDDIDVAMPRDDYDRLIEEGQKYLSDNLFIQSNVTDPQYPLAFAKIRDTNTAFIQPVLNNCNVNKGVYIDIFPIDFIPDDEIERRKVNALCRIYNLRVCTVLNIPNISKKHQLLQLVSKVIMPSWKKTMNRYANVYNTKQKTKSVIVFGGKFSEVGIPAEWFKERIEVEFEGVKSYAPKMYDEYLTRIYGDYLNYSPSEKYLNSYGEVEISADILDLEKSYLLYEK